MTSGFRCYTRCRRDCKGLQRTTRSPFVPFEVVVRTLQGKRCPFISLLTLQVKPCLSIIGHELMIIRLHSECVYVVLTTDFGN